LPKRGILPPFGNLFPVKDRQREVRRDFIKKCLYYYENANKAKDKDKDKFLFTLSLNLNLNLNLNLYNWR